MMNGAWPLQRARVLASRLERESSSDSGRLVSDAYRLVFGREPTAAESQRRCGFLDREEKLIPVKTEERPAPFLSDKMPFRDGRAARAHARHLRWSA